MADITTADGRVCQTDLRIEVGTVQIDLTTIIMNDFASLKGQMVNESTTLKNERELTS